MNVDSVTSDSLNAVFPSDRLWLTHNLHTFCSKFGVKEPSTQLDKQELASSWRDWDEMGPLPRHPLVVTPNSKLSFEKPGCEWGYSTSL